MIAADMTADGGGKRMSSILIRIIQSFGNNISRKCNIFGTAGTVAFIDTPADRAVVDDAVIGTGHPHSIQRRLRIIPHTRADMADDSIFGAEHPEGIPSQTNALSRSGLTRYIDIAAVCRNCQFVFQKDGASNAKNNNSSSLFYFDSFPE